LLVPVSLSVFTGAVFGAALLFCKLFELVLVVVVLWTSCVFI